MGNYETKRATVIILVVISVLLIAIVTIVLLLRDDDQVLGNFSSNGITINEKELEDTNSESFKTTRRTLENDFNLKKELIIDDFKSSKFSGEDLQKVLWNFIFSFDIKNDKYVTNLTGENFCLRKYNVIDAFKELYDIDITEYLNLIKGYKKYVSIDDAKYCFNYRNVSNEFNNEIKLGISTIKVNKTTLIANVYVFEYYTLHTNLENNNIKVLESYINSKNYQEAAKVVRDNLYGKVTLKQVEFKVNKRAKFFKYQILSIKNIV